MAAILSTGRGEEMDISKSEINELIRLSKPIRERLKGFHPYVSVKITSDSIRVDETIWNCPNLIDDKEMIP